MEKVAWLIASDLHLYYKNISSHLDYVNEMLEVRGNMLETAMKYKAEGYTKVNLLLLGDVFHRSYTSVDSAVYDCNFFVLWREKIGDCYSVIGNHELSYYKSNPFFSLVKEIESQRVLNITDRVWTPTGLLPIIRVVDTIECGDVVFHFNHNRCLIARPTDSSKVNIGLFHQEIVCNEIVSAMNARLGDEIYASTIDFDSTDIFSGYNYCFFGHMHKVYGTWKLESGTVVSYLASLGRTNVSEVNDSFLERNLPVVKVIDGKFSGIDDNFIRLPSFEESISVSVAEKNKEEREKAKLIRSVRDYSPLDDDPVQSLMNFYSNDEYMLELVRGLYESGFDAIGINLRARFNRRFQ